MLRTASIAWFTVLLGVTIAVAKPPAEAEVQGLYEGQITGAEELKVEARVVALGGNKYKLLLREMAENPGEVRKFELAGKTEAEKVTFAGQTKQEELEVAWTAEYNSGEIRGEGNPERKLHLKRVQRRPPTLGKKPPKGAVVLLDGKNFDKLVRRNNDPWYLGTMEEHGTPVWEVSFRRVSSEKPQQLPAAGKPVPQGWQVSPQPRKVDEVVGVDQDGSIQIPRGGMSSKPRFDGSFDAHIEFLCPLRASARSQGRGNSGVDLPNGDEIQVLDSFGMDTYKGGGCGGLYKYKNPDAFDVFSLASLPPLEWQTYDIQYRVRRDENGKLTGKPVLTVWHNGILIHDHVEPQRGARPGDFKFQDHGNPVRYRNIWVLPVDEVAMPKKELAAEKKDKPDKKDSDKKDPSKKDPSKKDPSKKKGKEKSGKQDSAKKDGDAKPGKKDEPR